MFNFIPKFGRFIASQSEWASVPLSLLPYGYKIQRKIVNGRNLYRVSGPAIPLTTARSIEHARWMIAEAVRRSKEQSNGLMQDDARQEEATYAAALVGFTRDEHGDDLIFIIDEMGAAEYGSYDTLGDLADPLKDWIVNSADVIDDLASNSCGLLFDLNSQEPFAWFEESGFVGSERFSEVEDLSIQFSTTLAR
ncbi:hypothetical protein LAC81_29580 [Ensifer adhaerens]|uniref:hypothetical protein n=1 Tax=Ensifer adhaerens TaxID=106592 RepID=UPI001CBBF357|nr:hypothetical protein [Ensifer adhaerens]MBZ7924891.1 hypothetical protein [Ensifer adhaerens]UAX95894.1 hypothetical protein LAC78_34250 [Ensifer adhaerens]UAY04764.1 hypothetical protein LAC80_26060 [Ensifer adhaerens]UAY10195.1 hypothetical protein LAC81_29580 [Ensifer adhaerens]